ncbi:MAG: sel1 repeat family protein [Paludibacteraceae bacterium]|nr:sel1 repeat family protein [Paludibacteraceae bacterium]
MSAFSPELFKAASGAKSLPINKERIDDPSFVTPVYEDYAAKGDLTGYMTALWHGAAVRDIECLQVLLYLAIKCHEPEDVMDLIDMLIDTDDDSFIPLWQKLSQIIKDAKKWPKEIYEDEKKYKSRLSAEFENALCVSGPPDCLFGEAEPELLRAYLNNVGRQSDAKTPDEEITINNCVPEETKNYWRGLYRRDDCSSNQEVIYHDALTYAQKGDPFAMHVVGYLLNHGIQTKYSNPNITLLECDHQKALPWLKRAADAGVPEACYEVACALFNTCYVSTSRESCTPEMMHYIKKGAELNERHCLERCFQWAENDEEAFGYLVRLADAWHKHEYKLKLAEYYEKGRGCEKDEKKAFELAEYVWKNSSASPYDSSYEDSVELLYRYLREGIGCEPDPERAGKIYCWYKDDEDRMWELLTK